MPTPPLPSNQVGGPIMGADLGINPAQGYGAYETLPPASPEDLGPLNAALTGLGAQQGAFGGVDLGLQPEGAQPQPPAQTPPPPPSGGGDDQYATKSQAVTEGDDQYATREDTQYGTASAEQSAQEAAALENSGIPDNAQNRKFREVGFISVIDGSGRVWWVDPWSVGPGFTGIIIPQGAGQFDSTSGDGLPAEVLSMYRSLATWKAGGYSASEVGNIYELSGLGDLTRDNTGLGNDLSGYGKMKWERDENGKFYLSIGRAKIVDGKIYYKVPKPGSAYETEYREISFDAWLDEMSKYIVGGPGGKDPGVRSKLANALQAAMAFEKVGQQHGNAPENRSGPGGYDEEGNPLGPVDANNNGIPDFAEEGNVPPPADKNPPEDLNKRLNEALAKMGEDSSEKDMATLEANNRVVADQATRKLAQTLAGRGMADSGVAAEMGGQLGSQYARDLAEEQMQLFQQQRQSAGQVAQLLFADKWNALSREQQIRMQNLVLRHQKELAAYLNALQQGNPGMIEATLNDLERATGVNLGDILGGILGFSGGYNNGGR